MKIVLFAIATFLLLTHSAFADDLTQAELTGYSTPELKAKLRNTRLAYVARCPFGVVTSVFATGVQILPLISTANPMVGRSTDWSTADWAMQDAFAGSETDEVYAAAVGGILAPVYDTVKGSFRELADLITEARVSNEYRFQSSRVGLRIVGVQWSRGVGRRSACQAALRRASALRTEIGRRARR